MIIQSTKELTKAYKDDAGWDIKASCAAVIPAGSSAIVLTDLQMAIPSGWAGIVKPRSGLSFKNDLETGAGVIDAGYRAEIKLHLYNYGTSDYRVTEGDAVAQLIFIPVFDVEWLVTPADQLPPADRGDNGFGSSGV